MISIVPAILATNETEFSEQLEKLKSSPELEGGWIHIDLMDGKFVKTTSLDLASLKKFDIPYHKEAHLMVQNSLEWIEPLKALKFKRIIIHIESQDVKDAIQKIQDAGLEVGLAINPSTDLNLVKPFLDDINVLQIMDVEPGEQGKPFIDSSYDKVKEAALLFEYVAVDGGVNDQTATKLVAAGTQQLVVGSYLQKGNIDENIEKIWEVTR